jgi:hypothetical protein
MKKFLFILIFSPSLLFAQTKNKSTYIASVEPVKTYNYDDAYIYTYVTPNKDTIYVKNNRSGYLIKLIWDTDTIYKGRKPIIILTNNLPKHNSDSIK